MEHAPLVRPRREACFCCCGRPAAEVEVMDLNSCALQVSESRPGSVAFVSGSPTSSEWGPTAFWGRCKPRTYGAPSLTPVGRDTKEYVMSEAKESGMCAAGIEGMQVRLDLHHLCNMSPLKGCSLQGACQ